MRITGFRLAARKKGAVRHGWLATSGNLSNHKARGARGRCTLTTGYSVRRGQLRRAARPATAAGYNMYTYICICAIVLVFLASAARGNHDAYIGHIEVEQVEQQPFLSCNRGSRAVFRGIHVLHLGGASGARDPPHCRHFQQRIGGARFAAARSRPARPVRPTTNGQRHSVPRQRD
jgi:hypothetical protein